MKGEFFNNVPSNYEMRDKTNVDRLEALEETILFLAQKNDELFLAMQKQGRSNLFHMKVSFTCAAISAVSCLTLLWFFY
jgi:hypothetical protein